MKSIKGTNMSLTSAPVVTKLNFSKFASDVRKCDGVLESSEKKIQEDIIEQAPSWVAAHVTDQRNLEVIHLEGTQGHPNWNENVRRAIVKRLKFHKNTAGHSVALRADGDR